MSGVAYHSDEFETSKIPISIRKGDNELLIKTNDNDLDAIFRAAVNGFGLLEKPVDAIHQQLQILARHRRDLVKKGSKLQCQIRHHLEQGLPGFGALFDGDDLWTQVKPVPLLEAIAAYGGTVDVLKQAGQKGVTKSKWCPVGSSIITRAVSIAAT